LIATFLYLRAKSGVGATASVILHAAGRTWLNAWHPDLCEPDAAERLQWLDERRQILRGVVDTLALALANLRLRETLRQQSIRDPNTGLFNRRYLEETSSRELRRMERSHLPLVMMLDVDHFKQFNDTFGHPAGDEVLRQLARVLSDTRRANDVVARYGGEEFAVILVDTAKFTAAKVAERVRERVAAHDFTDAAPRAGRIGVSIGVATFPDDGADAEALVRAADTALYAAKRAGRNRVVLATESLAATVVLHDP
jgi:diguanylate cyclase (GGDEF)-like protein